MVLQLSTRAQLFLFGQELNDDTAAMAKMNMFLHDLEAEIEPVIKTRRNSVPGTASARGRAVEEFLDMGYESWACEKGYGDRWMVETAYSTFKRLFGECSLSRTLENIAHELVAKVALYNLLVNM